MRNEHLMHVCERIFLMLRDKNVYLPASLHFMFLFTPSTTMWQPFWSRNMQIILGWLIAFLDTAKTWSFCVLWARTFMKHLSKVAEAILFSKKTLPSSRVMHGRLEALLENWNWPNQKMSLSLWSLEVCFNFDNFLLLSRSTTSLQKKLKSFFLIRSW